MTDGGIDELCRICGDKSIGYNFNVVSCDSCRSFWRRCGGEKTRLECPFNGNCQITKQSRRFCRACRLKKCIKEGMRHENVKPTDSAYSPKPKKIKKEVGIKKAKCTCKCQCGFYPSNVELIAVNSPFTPQPYSPAQENIHIMNAEDNYLLMELVSANSILKAPMELTLKELDTTNEVSLLSVVRISDLAMRRIIAMAKQLSNFQRISSYDQIALMKGGLSELLILRGVMCFDPAKNTWAHNIYNGNRQIIINVDVMKETPEAKHYAIHRNFLRDFDEKWRTNEKCMLILNAIVLFSPDRKNIGDVELVRQIQTHYFNLLRKYIYAECLSSDTQPDSHYDYLMKQLVKLRDVNYSLQLVYTKLNDLDYLEPLLKELFASS